MTEQKILEELILLHGTGEKLYCVQNLYVYRIN